jgi:hypothetical protein
MYLDEYTYLRAASRLAHASLTRRHQRKYP